VSLNKKKSLFYLGKIRNNKLDQLQVMSAKMAANGYKISSVGFKINFYLGEDLNIDCLKYQSCCHTRSYVNELSICKVS